MRVKIMHSEGVVIMVTLILHNGCTLTVFVVLIFMRVKMMHFALVVQMVTLILHNGWYSVDGVDIHALGD